MIDYQNLGYAVLWYSVRGFKVIDLPWVASRETIEATLPEGHTIVNSDLGCLVGSAEQSFLELVKTIGLKGKYQATTPCFRNEPVDDTHQKYFMKTELFQNINVTEENLLAMIETARGFFNIYGKGVDAVVVKTGELSYDIIDASTGIELGSYGIRNHPNFGSWIYGTGCSEPRFTIVQQKSKS